MKPTVRGGAFILALLVMLALLALAALGLMSAYSDLKLARTASAWVEQYYELESAANEALCETNEALREIYITNNGYPAGSLEALDGWTREDNILVRDITQGGERAQNLRVEILPSPPQDGRYYVILAWRQWQDAFEYETQGENIWLE